MPLPPKSLHLLVRALSWPSFEALVSFSQGQLLQLFLFYFSLQALFSLEACFQETCSCAGTDIIGAYCWSKCHIKLRFSLSIFSRESDQSCRKCRSQGRKGLQCSRLCWCWESYHQHLYVKRLGCMVKL